MFATANLTNPRTVNNRIYVGNLSPSVNSTLLETKFSQYGQIFGISRKAPTFCFIEFSDSVAAQAAIEAENESYFCGRRITVKKVSSNQVAVKRKLEETQEEPDTFNNSKIVELLYCRCLIIQFSRSFCDMIL